MQQQHQHQHLQMAANPALVQTFSSELVPAPFANELFALRRPKVGFELDGVQTRSGKCVRAQLGPRRTAARSRGGASGSCVACAAC